MFRITTKDESGAYTQKDIKQWAKAIAYLLRVVLEHGEKDGHNSKLTLTIEWQ
jgi:hypothetical protein